MLVEPIRSDKYPSHVVRHKDGDKSINLPENLYLSNKSDLIRNTFKSGKHAPPTRF